MATAERDLLTVSGPQTVALVGEIWRTRGHVIRVAVKDAGNGPAIDVREWIEADAYDPEDFANAGKPVRVGKGKSERFVKLRTPYVGPTKAGFWLTLETCEVLTEALASTLIVAGNLEEQS